MSRRSRSRIERMRDRRRDDTSSSGAITSIKLAGLGAALVLFAAVAIGFRSEEASETLSRLEGLSVLVEPVVLGVSLMELLAFAVLAGFAWWVLRRG